VEVIDLTGARICG